MSEIGDRIVRLHQAGLKSLEIAYRLNVAHSTVHYHLRKVGPEAAVSSRSRSSRRPGSTVKTRDLVAQLLARGFSRVEVAQRLGLAKSTVTYHARQLGEGVDERLARRFDWPLIQACYADGHSLRDCMRTFGFGNSSWQLAVRRGQIVPRPRFRPVDEVFVANSRRNRGPAEGPAPNAGSQREPLPSLRDQRVAGPAALAGAPSHQRRSARQPSGKPRAALSQLSQSDGQFLRAERAPI